MSLSFLRAIDRWMGICLLCLFALPARAAGLFIPARRGGKPRYVFLKLKGGGSLIIAMPALLGLRRRFPEAEFILVCAREAKIYAELTGVFDRFIVIGDSSLWTLAVTGLRALRGCFAAYACIDLEPNSWLAALFTMLTCATRRIGLVKPKRGPRALAYNSALAFDPAAPVYLYYDRVCERLGATPASLRECRDATRALLPPPLMAKAEGTNIAIVAFTSDFARERMMPARTWIALLRQAYGDAPINALVFGSPRDKNAARQLSENFKAALPAATVFDLAGAGSLAEAAAQLTLCDEVWAVDSGLLHIARLLGVPNRSFWGPVMPAQRLRPIEGLAENVRYRPFLCSPCIGTAAAPPCRGDNLCMISMAEESPDLHPSWIKGQ